MRRIGLLKSGNLMNWWKLVQGVLFMNDHLVCSQSTRTNLLFITKIWTLTPSQNQTCRYYPDPFLHKVNDRVRKIQNQSSKDATQDSNKHSLIWGMFMSSTLEASVFMGKNNSKKLHSIKNIGKDLRMKQMFDISEKLMTEQSDEINWVNTTNWRDSAKKHSSLIGDEEVFSLSRAKVYIFSDSVLCFGKTSENPLSNVVWEDKLTCFKSSSQYWTFKSRRRSCWNMETCLWTTTQFVHTMRGHRHRLQSVWISTCSCATSRKLSCSRTREEDQESFSSTSSSSRFATKQRLQPIQ